MDKKRMKERFAWAPNMDPNVKLRAYTVVDFIHSINPKLIIGYLMTSHYSITLEIIDPDAQIGAIEARVILKQIGFISVDRVNSTKGPLFITAWSSPGDVSNIIAGLKALL